MSSYKNYGLKYYAFQCDDKLIYLKEMKDMNARWNSRMKGGCGWLVPKCKKDELELFIKNINQINDYNTSCDNSVNGTYNNHNILADADGTITSSAAGEVHLPALTAHGAIDINAASAIALTSLVTTTAVIDLNTTPAVIATNLVEVDHNITWEVGAISLPNANLDAGSIISAVATNVNGVVITSSPGLKPKLIRAICNASVPFPHGIVYFTLRYSDR